MITTNLQNHFKSYSYDIIKIFNEFKKPIYENLFFINKKGLISNSKYIDFKAKWEYNPLQFSQDIYKEQYVYPVILLCNNIGSLHDFTSENLDNKVLSPDLKNIISIISR